MDSIIAAIPSSLHIPLLYTIPVLVAVIVYPFLARYIVRKLDAALSRINSIGASILQSKDTRYRLYHPSSILLPNQTVPIKKIGLDIGGSLAKLVYFEPNGTPETDTDVQLGVEDELQETIAGGTLRFVKFEVRKLHELIEFMRGTLKLLV